ncbi:hypothetical protein LL965_17835, partial [Xanthomonas cassavae CFBP 4642]
RRSKCVMSRIGQFAGRCDYLISVALTPWIVECYAAGKGSVHSGKESRLSSVRLALHEASALLARDAAQEIADPVAEPS